jgi:hypothetical protein
LEAFARFIPAVDDLCPDPSALEFLANFAQKWLLDRFAEVGGSIVGL